MTKVAVITRTKDRPVFLARAIKSVSSQTYQDYVHVIVNDGGEKDAVQAVIDGFSEEVKHKVKFFHRDVASGAPDTIFNESIDRVSSDYVVIHDDDDTWHPEFIEQCIAVLDGGAEGVVVRTDKITEKLDGETLALVKREQFMPDLRAVSLFRQCIDNQLTPIAFMYRRDAYETVGKYDSSLPVVGDWEFGIRFLRKFDVEYLDPGFALAFYHHRSGRDNSFAAHDHRTYITKVFNKYLREELDKGELGVGYIMNSLRYEQDMITTNIKKMLPKPIMKLVKRRVR